MSVSLLDFPKQFVLSRDPAPAVEGGKTAAFAGWTVHAAPRVPLVGLVDPSGGRSGLLIGWAIRDGRLLADGDAVGDAGGFADRVFPDLAGRFVVLWREGGVLRFRTDASGFLPAVFDRAAGVIASSSTLVARLHPREVAADVEAVFAFPKRRGFLPFGLTRYRGVERLQASHVLDLGAWTVQRVWPDPALLASPPASRAEAAALAAEVAGRVKSQVEAVIRGGRGMLYLSGGHDSRMILAACRDFRAEIVCETLVNEAALDRHIPRKLASRFGLEHVLIDIVPSPPGEIAGWLERTGHTVYDAVTELAETARRIDRHYHVMDGTGAEIMRATNWWPEDLEAPRLELATLLRRLRLPDVPVFRAAGRAWLDGLPAADATQALDIAKIEQIHGCWSGAAIYGHRIETPSMSPFSSQRINEIALRLPKDYKMAGGFYRDFVSALWPELLEVPVNRAVGLERLVFARQELKRLMPTKIKRWIKPLR